MARMSRLFARVETNPVLASRFTELAGEYEEKARLIVDEASIERLPPQLTTYGDENCLRPRLVRGAMAVVAPVHSQLVGNADCCRMAVQQS